ncbi:alkaline phosphatase [Desulfopila sp. IMCC35006]|uniref:alkaline phosphatase n=1 Tax=Desulfopila sp. IMCC35006 TaxID=2569542 RepID=UPI0010AD7741|nr:alkaline phosphatase [Desulfopila sp. IMCC35006]
MRRNRLILVAAGAMLLSATATLASEPKYVFFFLGDGMANAQIQATEAYLTTLNGGSASLATDLLQPENRLNMSKLPVQGMQTTYDAFSLMTDSASSATAFSCGIKTKSGVINMDPGGTVGYKSIAQLAHERGMKVGVISSVSLDHATPAAYYANVQSRNQYGDIDEQLAASGYEFFGGGGLKVLSAEAVGEKGYTVLNDRESIMALKDAPRDKVICINPWLQDSAAMPYAIDRPDTNLSLAEMTGVAISVLKDDKQGKGWKHGRNWQKHDKDDGFFLMVEGGKIDWACHANDAMAAIGDMLDFDDAVGVALAFYQKHPHETLIVVTGDHETGGMTIGHATTQYSAHYDKLLGQQNSFTYFDQKVLPTLACKNTFESDVDFQALVKSMFGLDFNSLNDYQKEKLNDAYAKSLCGGNDNSESENTFLYGSYTPITVTLTHILNENASIGWTSYSHTGVPVPVYSIGQDAELFGGFFDNTDIAKKMAKAMNIRQALPVIR